MTDILLSVEELSKRYTSGKLAIDAVSFGLSRGECLGLVGESGCGKSTLARCLMRIEPITEGTIRFHGKAIERLSERELRPYRKNMQMVLQNPSAALNPRLRIRESLLDPYEQYQHELQLSHFACTSSKAFIHELMEAVELPASLADRYPHELSGGQRQRVTIARAISIEPDLIVLDEPTASLDVLSQGAVLKLLQELQEALGLAYLFISHDLTAVHQLSHRIMVMHEGQLVDQFEREQLFYEGRHEYTKSLISIY